jgi:hypothetical protein
VLLVVVRRTVHPVGLLPLVQQQGLLQLVLLQLVMLLLLLAVLLQLLVCLHTQGRAAAFKQACQDQRHVSVCGAAGLLHAAISYD